MKKSNIFKLFLFNSLITILVCFTGCKDNPVSSTPIDANGTWEGTTSQKYRITFVVESEIVTSITISYVIPGVFQTTTVTGSLCSVENDSFSYTIEQWQSPDIYVTGEFRSSSSAKGSFTVSTLKGTWTASKR